MTHKRFKIEWIEEEMYPMPIYYDDEDKKLSYDKVCGLLNELHEENEQLKHDATVLIYSNHDYRKENEQLKEEKQVLYEDIDFLRIFIEKQGFKVKLDSDTK